MPSVDLTNEAFARWLRAQRPDLVWFLALEPEQQETMALMGDEYVVDLLVAAGKALSDPVAVEAGLDAATNPESEEILARRVAAGLVREALGVPAQAAPQRAPVARGALTMAGLGDRRQSRAVARQAARDGTRSFLGRRPDSITEAEEGAT